MPPARARRDGDTSLGDGVHGGRDDRDGELDGLGESVRVPTSAGSTDDSAGTSSTSSKVRPSFANFGDQVLRLGTVDAFGQILDGPGTDRQGLPWRESGQNRSRCRYRSSRGAVTTVGVPSRREPRRWAGETEVLCLRSPRRPSAELAGLRSRGGTSCLLLSRCGWSSPCASPGRRGRARPSAAAGPQPRESRPRPRRTSRRSRARRARSARPIAGAWARNLLVFGARPVRSDPPPVPVSSAW